MLWGIRKPVHHTLIKSIYFPGRLLRRVLENGGWGTYLSSRYVISQLLLSPFLYTLYLPECPAVLWSQIKRAYPLPGLPQELTVALKCVWPPLVGVATLASAVEPGSRFLPSPWSLRAQPFQHGTSGTQRLITRVHNLKLIRGKRYLKIKQNP